MPLSKLLWLVIFFFSMVQLGDSHAGQFHVPDTSQTLCYDYEGNEISPCPLPEALFYGQDACYEINPSSYTKLDEFGNPVLFSGESWAMVQDNVTGLIWEAKTDDKSIHDKDNTYTWYDADPDTNGQNEGVSGNGTDTMDFIERLNAINFGGYSDWRLPTIDELASITDKGTQEHPTVNRDFFPNTMSSYYFSATTNVSNRADAWAIGFYYGHDHSPAKSDRCYVRAVRSNYSTHNPTNQFIIDGDGTVTDENTRLMWQQANNGKMSWTSALSYCEELSLGGYQDWRLPTIEELRSIVDYRLNEPALDLLVFSDTMSSYYWSSTTRTINPADAWAIDFCFGLATYTLKIRKSFVRAVRSLSSETDNPPIGDVFNNSLGMTFIWIQPGTFAMGSPENEVGRFLREPLHEVTLTKGYYMQTTEVTQSQWITLMGTNPSYFVECGEDCPVEQISWDDVQEFINALNTSCEDGNTYALPSEAQWEYAARAGTTTAFYNGNITEVSCGHDPNLDLTGWYCGNSDTAYEGCYDISAWDTSQTCTGTHPVARKSPNAWGLYDMSGNVYEWCRDWYGPYPEDLSIDPEGPDSGAGRVKRGGSWSSYSTYCRPAFRSVLDQAYRSMGVGFRLILIPAEQ